MHESALDFAQDTPLGIIQKKNCTGIATPYCTSLDTGDHTGPPMDIVKKMNSSSGIDTIHTTIDIVQELPLGTFQDSLLGIVQKKLKSALLTVLA